MNRNKSIRVAILCLSLAMAGSLPIDAQKVTFHEGSISLKQAFEKLESSSAYKIAYNDSQLDVSRKVSMDQKDMEVLQVLSQLLKNTGYTYKINGNYVIIVPEEVKTVKGKKQVSGVIVDTNGGLRGGTAYDYRISVDNAQTGSGSFTTAGEIALTNGGFEDWSQDGKQWNPWPSGGTSFWGTGNPGAAAFIGNLTTPTTESVSGKAALLESKDAVIKLGAGNIFTGDFALDGTNGVLQLGRPFTSFPTSLKFQYKYTSTTINRIGQDVGSLENLRGRPDSCQIYIALSDKPEPYEIRTKPSVRQVFDKNDRNIIAYGEFISGQSTTSYKQVEIPLEYRATNRTPKYIVIVAAASKYGDYFIGGEGSTLWIDEMELVYE